MPYVQFKSLVVARNPEVSGCESFYSYSSSTCTQSVNLGVIHNTEVGSCRPLVLRVGIGVRLAAFCAGINVPT